MELELRLFLSSTNLKTKKESFSFYSNLPIHPEILNGEMIHSSHCVQLIIKLLFDCSKCEVIKLICSQAPFGPPPLRPVAGLLAEPLLDAGAQRLLVVQPVESLQDSALVGLVFVATRVNL